MSASSMTYSAWTTSEPPWSVSLRSAVTVTGARPSDGFGLAVTRLVTGPTTSVGGGGAAVSRKVSMPPVAVCVGSAVVWLALARTSPASERVTLASGPLGIVVMVSSVWPGDTAATVSRCGYAAGCPSEPTTTWSPPSRPIAWVSDPALT